jgi:hypothetical protein
LSQQYPLKWTPMQPDNSQVLGEGQFLAPKAQPVALTLQLLKIPQGEYVTRILSSHIRSIALKDQGVSDLISESIIYYELKDPKPHPDGEHIVIPFKTYAVRS